MLRKYLHTYCMIGQNTIRNYTELAKAMSKNTRTVLLSYKTTLANGFIALSHTLYLDIHSQRTDPKNSLNEIFVFFLLLFPSRRKKKNYFLKLLVTKREYCFESRAYRIKFFYHLNPSSNFFFFFLKTVLVNCF